MRARAAAARTARVARSCFVCWDVLGGGGACSGAVGTTSAGGGGAAGGGAGAGSGAGVVDAAGAGGGGGCGSLGGSGFRPAVAPWANASVPALRTVQTHTPSSTIDAERRTISAGPTATNDASPGHPAQGVWRMPAPMIFPGHFSPRASALIRGSPQPWSEARSNLAAFSHTTLVRFAPPSAVLTFSSALSARVKMGAAGIEPATSRV